jgi:hypothetical protein
MSIVVVVFACAALKVKLSAAASISNKFAVPGRPTGSYVMTGSESVTALLTFFTIALGASVSRIRDAASGADLDIFEVGSRRESTRRVGAGEASHGSHQFNVSYESMSMRGGIHTREDLGQREERTLFVWRRVGPVEGGGEIPGELEVLCLIFAYGDVCCSITLSALIS